MARWTGEAVGVARGGLARCGGRRRGRCWDRSRVDRARRFRGGLARRIARRDHIALAVRRGAYFFGSGGEARPEAHWPELLPHSSLRRLRGGEEFVRGCTARGELDRD